MSETTTSVILGGEEYRNFAERFERERAKMGDGPQVMQIAGATLGIALLALLLWLQSGPAVFVYVAILFGGAYYGLRQIRDATREAQSAAKDLNKLALAAEASASREEFLEAVASRGRASDRSDVPDALLNLASGAITGERAQGVARAAFRSALARMNEAAFVRTALVLGGLFGTVFFFANELIGREILQGNLSVLLPGLRGALASTLTGIAASLLLGLLASRLERLVDDTVAETEAFLLGPVSMLLQATTARRAVTTETDLWQRLVEEVAELRREATDSFASMGTDAHGFAKQLEGVVGQMRMLPAVTVPPNIADLGIVVTEFRAGMKNLKETVDILVPAVQTIGATLPLEVAANVQSLLEREAAGQRAVQSQFSEIRSAISRLDGAVSENRNAIEALRQEQRAAPAELLAQASAARDEAHATRQDVAQLASGFAEQGQKLGRIQEALRTAEDTQIALARTQEALVHAAQIVQTGARDLSVESASLHETASRIDEATGRFTDVGSTLQNRLSGIDELLRKVDQQRGMLTRIEELVGGTVEELLTRLTPLSDWHRRAASAPMMRFLTLPLWAGDRQASMRDPEGQGHAPS